MVMLEKKHILSNTYARIFWKSAQKFEILRVFI